MLSSDNKKKAWKFSADAHQSTYLKHIKSLNHIKGQNKAAYSVLLANIYRKARLVNFEPSYAFPTDPRLTSRTVGPSVAMASSLVKMNPARMSKMYD